MLVSNRDDLVAEVCASILSRCCEVHSQEETIEQFDPGLKLVMELLDSKLGSVQEAGMEAIASLTRKNKRMAQIVGRDAETIEKLLRLSKLGKTTNVKLLSCRCIANLTNCVDGMRLNRKASNPASGLGDFEEPGEGLWEEAVKLRMQVLPIVIRLLEQLADAHVPHILAKLVKDSSDLQRMAHDANAVSILTSWLQNPGPATGAAELREGILLAIGAIAENLEDARRQVNDLDGIPTVVKMLKDADPKVRAAACFCAKSLSRSQKAIKKRLFDANIDTPLLSLLRDPSSKVQASASATLCNLALNYQPMKENLLSNGGVRELGELARSEDGVLRLHSAWAIKNILYRADRRLKEQVMQELAWPQLLQLLNDEEREVQAQAVGIVRNLVHGKESDIEHVIRYRAGEILHILERILSGDKGHSSSEGDDSSMRTMCMYAISNITSGSDEHKEVIMQSPIIESVLQCLKDKCCELRVAAAWTIINLSWPKDGDESKVESRVKRLKEMGFQGQLESMKEDASLNVKDRVMQALKHFSPYDK
mmetsp:Transcript_7199/g.18392  ORF Transcript_7199/g.18392 Transcript_7199/m.18392 type:complete len:538 (+) Transcript_7199:639-2252(+)